MGRSYQGGKTWLPFQANFLWMILNLLSQFKLPGSNPQTIRCIPMSYPYLFAMVVFSFQEFLHLKQEKTNFPASASWPASTCEALAGNAWFIKHKPRDLPKAEHLLVWENWKKLSRYFYSKYIRLCLKVYMAQINLCSSNYVKRADITHQFYISANHITLPRKDLASFPKLRVEDVWRHPMTFNHGGWSGLY